MIDTARTGFANSIAATHDVPPVAANLPSGSSCENPSTRNTPYPPSAPLPAKSSPSRRRRFTIPHATSALPQRFATESAAVPSAATATAVSASPSGVTRGACSLHGVAYTRCPRRRLVYSLHHRVKSTAPLLEESALRSQLSRMLAAARMFSDGDAFAAGRRSSRRRSASSMRVEFLYARNSFHVMLESASRRSADC